MTGPSDLPFDRRRFVGGLAAAGAMAAIPRPLHAFAERAAPALQPEQKLRIACIGVGGMGHSDVRGVSGEELVAFADVDWRSAERPSASIPPRGGTRTSARCSRRSATTSTR
jgi:hypothetical protein